MAGSVYLSRLRYHMAARGGRRLTQTDNYYPQEMRDIKAFTSESVPHFLKRHW